MTTPQASDLLRAAHRRMETHLDALLDALKHLSSERVSDVGRSFQEIQRLARTHFEQEENVFYPEVRSLSQELLSHMEQQHQDIRQTEHSLDEILATFPESPSGRNLDELRRLGIEFHDAVQCHIVDEEDHLLKLADQQFSSHQQQRLYAAMQKIAAGPSGGGNS